MSTMRMGWAAAMLALEAVLTPAVQAYPVMALPETVVTPRNSQYRQGYTDAAGILYTGVTFQRADGTWGLPVELRQDLAVLKPQLAAGTARLVDYYDFSNKPVYQGNGQDLVAALTPDYTWKGQYGISFTGTSVLVEVGIGLDWSAITGPVDQAAWQTTWEQRIEGWWDRRYQIVKDDRLFFPIDFEVYFGGRDNGHGETVVDHEVDVLPDGGRDNSGEWHLDSGAQTNAHEFGHLLGLFDEYWTGGLDAIGRDITDPTAVPTDYFHLMGALIRFPFGGGMEASYFEPFMAWLDGVDDDPTQTYRLARIPEPAGLLLVVWGLGAIVLHRRGKWFARASVRRCAGGRTCARA